MTLDCRTERFKCIFFQSLIVIQLFLLQNLGHTDPISLQSSVISECSLDRDCSLYLSIQLGLKNPVPLFDLLLQQLSLLFYDPPLDPALFLLLTSFFLLCNVLYQHFLVPDTLLVAPPVFLNNYRCLVLLQQSILDCDCAQIAD